jgi:arylsulfatase
MGRLTENSVVTMNKSHAIAAEVVVPEGGASVYPQGGAFGGFSLYMTDGKPAYCYNLFGLQRFKTYGSEPVPSGRHQIRIEFTYDGGGLGKGGATALYVDGTKVGEGRVDATVPMLSRPRRPMSATTRRRRSPTISRRARPRSPARWTGCRSISAKTPKTPTT